MATKQNFSTFAAHVHDDTTFTSEYHADADGVQPYATVDIGGYNQGVNLRVIAWDRDTLRQLADAAALAYHQWTKAEAEARSTQPEGWPDELTAEQREIERRIAGVEA